MSDKTSGMKADMMKTPVRGNTDSRDRFHAQNVGREEVTPRPIELLRNAERACKQGEEIGKLADVEYRELSASIAILV